jgi:hypothetical protein
MGIVHTLLRQGKPHKKSACVALILLILWYTPSVPGGQNTFALVEDTEGVLHKVKGLIVGYGLSRTYEEGYLYAKRGESEVRLSMNEIASVEVIGSQRDLLSAIVTFRDGNRGKFTIKSRNMHLRGESRYGEWALGGSELKSITFTDANWNPLRKD